MQLLNVVQKCVRSGVFKRCLRIVTFPITQSISTCVRCWNQWTSFTFVFIEWIALCSALWDRRIIRIQSCANIHSTHTYTPHNIYPVFMRNINGGEDETWKLLLKISANLFEFTWTSFIQCSCHVSMTDLFDLMSHWFDFIGWQMIEIHRIEFRFLDLDFSGFSSFSIANRWAGAVQVWWWECAVCVRCARVWCFRNAECFGVVDGCKIKSMKYIVKSCAKKCVAVRPYEEINF